MDSKKLPDIKDLNFIEKTNIKEVGEFEQDEKFNFETDLESWTRKNSTDSQARRKDTKDSGYGDAISEREEEPGFIPEWCHECQSVNEDINHETAVTQDSNGANDDDKINTDSMRKPAKRHRRITPVPLAAPLKLCLAPKPECLFVEEEDAEDIQAFNSEDDFIDQGFISQMADSPIWKHKQLTMLKTSAFNKSEDSGQNCDDSQASRPYLRSKSENNEGKERTRDVLHLPDIELIPPISLPLWMQEAGQENDADDIKCISNEGNEGIAGIEGYNNTAIETSCSLSVKMRDTAIATLSTEWFENKDASSKVDINEDVLKIYLPTKENKANKGSRVRKLTPVRPTSPSLEKLSDLQKQGSAFSVREDVQNELEN